MERIDSQVLSPARQRGIDVAKGGTILLVVFVHVLVSSSDAGLVSPQGPWGAAQFVLFSGGLMATFMFLAGYCAGGRLDDARKVTGGILRGAVLPYLVWGAVFLAAQTVAGGLRNSAGTIAVDQSLLWTPIAWLWFLWAVAMFHGAALLLRRHRGALLVLGLMVLPMTELMPSQFARQLVMFLPFYGLGIWWGDRPIPAVRWTGIAAICSGLVLWSVDAPLFSVFAAPVALLWMLSTLRLSREAKGPIADALAWLGRRCMAVYVSHFFFITATRIVLEHGFGVTSFAANLAIGFPAGLIGSLAILWVSQRLGIAPLLGFGSIPPTAPSRPTPAPPLPTCSVDRSPTH